MTIVYLFSFVSNAARYFADPKKYDRFDFNLFPIAFAVVLGIAFLFPVAFGILMRCFAAQINMTEVLSIYGYSYVIFVPVILLCSIPSNVPSRSTNS
ncbi:MAG: hypothetical protein P4M11_11955 [Candidatus Pacebacteria bacterium]|nr:hypothetical protein [Candidatus Paceibacterota bacterium]